MRKVQIGNRNHVLGLLACIMKLICIISLLITCPLLTYGQVKPCNDTYPNSFIVTETGYSSFAVRPDITEISENYMAAVLWSDAPSIVSEVKFSDGLISFIAGNNEGNAIIALYDSNDNIVWSWHIWRRNDLPEDRIIMNAVYGRYVMMDCFLGEDSSGKGYLLYQWGRKDGFPSVPEVYIGNASDRETFLDIFPVTEGPIDSLSYSIAAPGSFISGDNWFSGESKDLWGDPAGYYTAYSTGGWSSDKSVYDPCPDGYRVANSYTFSGFTVTGHNTSKRHEFNVMGNWNGGWTFRVSPGDMNGIRFHYTVSRNSDNGELISDAEGHTWYSNPLTLNGDKSAAFMYSENRINTSEGNNTSWGFPVRCIRTDDFQDLATAEAERLWYSPQLYPYFGDYKDLSTNGTANCYTVTEEGNYRFNAKVKGNSKRKTGKISHAELLWTDMSCLIGNVELDEEGYVKFSVHRNFGNAVIAVYDNTDTILWSWHIWVTGEPIRDIAWLNDNNCETIIMDRALGAFSADDDNSCMLYQWGRKDPFPNRNSVFVAPNLLARRRFTDAWPPVNALVTGDIAHNNIMYAIQHPCTFITSDNEDGTWYQYVDSTIPYLWGDPTGYAAELRSTGRWSDVKSIYDPCPPGYRVSNSGSFTGMTTTGTGTTDPSQFRVNGDFRNGWYFKCMEGNDESLWFPLSGWFNKTTGMPGAINSRGAIWHSNPTGSDTKKMRRTMYHNAVVLPESSETSATGNAVRCVKEE